MKLTREAEATLAEPDTLVRPIVRPERSDGSNYKAERIVYDTLRGYQVWTVDHLIECMSSVHEISRGNARDIVHKALENRRCFRLEPPK